MNLNQLRAFYAVAKTGTFSKAAEELFVTEPAVFIQVRSLERFLGFKLLDKLEKNFTPTEVGRMLFSYVEKIFSLEEEADKAIKEVQALKSGELRVGTTKAVAQYFMPNAISLFQDLFPKVKVLLSEGNSDDLVKGVIGHEVELAITARIPYPNRISAIPLSKERLLIVLSPDYDLKGKEEVSLEELSDQPIICRDERSATRLAVSTAFEKQGVKPSAKIESGNTEFIKDMVRKNKGYSLLANICVRKEISQGLLSTARLKGGEITLDVDVIHHKGKTLSPAASTFLKFLRERCDADDLSRTVDSVGERREAALPLTIKQEDKKHLRLVENE